MYQPSTRFSISMPHEVARSAGNCKRKLRTWNGASIANRVITVMRGKNSAATHDYGDRHHKPPKKQCDPPRAIYPGAVRIRAGAALAPPLFYAEHAVMGMPAGRSGGASTWPDCRAPPGFLP